MSLRGQIAPSNLTHEQISVDGTLHKDVTNAALSKLRMLLMLMLMLPLLLLLPQRTMRCPWSSRLPASRESTW
jgi:hypothetical protein